MNLKQIIASFVIVMITFGLSADEKVDYGIMASKTFAAFECMTYSQRSTYYTDEAERLWGLGMEQGQKLVQAAADGKITDTSKMPVIVTLTIKDGGPSVDFIVGRLFDAAQEYAMDKIKEDISEQYKLDMDFQEIAANKLFHRGHCTLIR